MVLTIKTETLFGFLSPVDYLLVPVLPYEALEG